jgi:hypothetical protein
MFVALPLNFIINKFCKMSRFLENLSVVGQFCGLRCHMSASNIGIGFAKSHPNPGKHFGKPEIF